MSKWIACTDRMPEDGQKVVTLSGKYSYEAIFSSQTGEFISGICSCLNVTHWMPLSGPKVES